MEGLIFGRAYVRREICVSKSIGLACSGKEITIFAFFALYSRANSKYKSPRGAYIWRGESRRVFLRYDFGGAYIWRRLFSEFYGTLSSGSSLVKGRTCARDPVQQHFCSVPYGISTEAHAWHLGKEHTNLMNSGTPTITHFVEHSTRLYDCKG